MIHRIWNWIRKPMTIHQFNLAMARAEILTRMDGPWNESA